MAQTCHEPGSAGGDVMSALADFAGKYAAFIWPAYGVSAVGFVWMIADTLARARRWRKETQRHENRDET